MLTRKIAEQLKDGSGIIWGIDSSPAMIETAKHHVSDGPISHRRHGYSVIDATKLFDYLQCTDLTALDRHELGIVDSLQLVEERYTKIFSNAALHWSVLIVPPSPRMHSPSRANWAPQGSTQSLHPRKRIQGHLFSPHSWRPPSLRNGRPRQRFRTTHRSLIRHSASGRHRRCACSGSLVLR